MRPVRLARIAAEAEGVRLRALATRMVSRIVFAVLGLVFVVGALVFAHAAVWWEIRVGLEQSFLVATGALGGGDLVVAVVLLFLAGRSAPGRVEIEALEVRRQAVAGMTGALSLAQMVIPVLRLVAGMRRGRRERV